MAFNDGSYTWIIEVIHHSMVDRIVCPLYSDRAVGVFIYLMLKLYYEFCNEVRLLNSAFTTKSYFYQVN